MNVWIKGVATVAAALTMTTAAMTAAQAAGNRGAVPERMVIISAPQPPNTLLVVENIHQPASRGYFQQQGKAQFWVEDPRPEINARQVSIYSIRPTMEPSANGEEMGRASSALTVLDHPIEGSHFIQQGKALFWCEH